MQFSDSQLWSYSVLTSIRRNVDLVRNNLTGRLMIRRILPQESYGMMCLISNIHHPNLMTVYGCKQDCGVCVCLCEYIYGNTLDYYVNTQGVFDVKSSKRILSQICDGLEHLHKSGIVHRDIKPENIMLDNTGSVKIIDYSITRLIKPNMNKDTEVLGTAGYASPEQFGFRQTGAKADIYSCGVLLNYLLTGCLPNEKLYKGALTHVIVTCTEIDEDKRFDSVKELKAVINGKKKNRHRSFQPLPGFRSKHILPKIITVFFYIIWFLMALICVPIIGKIMEPPLKGDLSLLVLIADIMLFWSAFPYILFGNVFRLAEIIYPGNPKNGKRILNVLGVLSIVGGIVLLLFAIDISFPTKY